MPEGNERHNRSTYPAGDRRTKILLSGDNAGKDEDHRHRVLVIESVDKDVIIACRMMLASTQFRSPAQYVHERRSIENQKTTNETIVLLTHVRVRLARPLLNRYTCPFVCPSLDAYFSLKESDGAYGELSAADADDHKESECMASNEEKKTRIRHVPLVCSFCVAQNFEDNRFSPLLL